MNASNIPAGYEHDELSRDPDGEIALDWQNKAGDMLSMSLSKDGRLAWAVHRAGPNGSGTALLNEHAYWLLNDVLDETPNASDNGACVQPASCNASDLPQAAPEADPYFGVQDEVALTRAVCVMNDVLTDIEGWEDQALANAVKESRIDLCAMIEVIRMRADPSYVCGSKPIDGNYGSIAAPLQAEAPAPQAVVGEASDVPDHWPTAWRDVVLERHRQAVQEGWTARHDDKHASGSMALAAACYVCNAASWAQRDASIPAADYAKFAAPGYRWPWEMKWWKPKSQRQDLVRAGALILAEIERLDRREVGK